MARYKVSLMNDKNEAIDTFNFVAIDDLIAAQTARDCAARMHWPTGSRVVLDEVLAESNQAEFTTDQIKYNMQAAVNAMTEGTRNNVDAIIMLSESIAQTGKNLKKFITE